MSKGLYDATEEEIQTMLYLLGKLSGEDLHTVSGWILLSESNSEYAAKPKNFIEWMTVRAHAGKARKWRLASTGQPYRNYRKSIGS